MTMIYDGATTCAACGEAVPVPEVPVRRTGWLRCGNGHLFRAGSKMDLRVEGGGTIYLLRPLSRRGRRWVKDHIDPEAMTFGGAIAVEHRFIAAIVTGARADGLEVRRG